MRIIKIEQRLQEPARFLLFPLDEAVAFLLPFLLGFMGRKMILGLVIGAVCWWGWRKLKGEGGLDRLAASTYWFLPTALNIYKGLPNSAVSVWKG